MGAAVSAFQSLATRAPKAKTQPKPGSSGSSKKGKGKEVAHNTEIDADLDVYDSVLTLRIVEGRNLKAMDSNGLSDPYVIARVGKTEFVTKIKFRTLNPVWNETFQLELPAKEYADVRLTVMDNDLVGADDLIGEAMAECDGAQQQLWLPLENAEFPEGCGDVLVEIWRRNRAVSPCVSTLRVKIISGHDLPAMDVIGSSDPYAVVTYAGRKRTTDVIMKNLNPRWGQTYDFPFLSGTPKAEKLKIAVYDWDRFGDHDLIGEAEIETPDLDAPVLHAWFDLLLKDDGGQFLSESRGRIRVLINCCHTALLNPQDCHLNILVKSGRRLTNGAGPGGNPIAMYCTLEFKGQTFKTGVRAATSMPNWDESTDFTCSSEDLDQVIKVCVHDTRKKADSDLFCGSTHVDLFKLLPYGTVNAKWYRLADPTGPPMAAEVSLASTLTWTKAAVEIKERVRIPRSKSFVFGQESDPWILLPRRPSLDGITDLTVNDRDPDPFKKPVKKLDPSEQVARDTFEAELKQRLDYDVNFENEEAQEKKQAFVRSDRNSFGLCSWCAEPFSILKKPQKCAICGMLYHDNSTSSVQENSCFHIHEFDEANRLREARVRARQHVREMQRRRLWDRTWESDESQRIQEKKLKHVKLLEAFLETVLPGSSDPETLPPTTTELPSESTLNMEDSRNKEGGGGLSQKSAMADSSLQSQMLIPMGSLDAEVDVPAQDTIGVSTTLYQIPAMDLISVGLTPVFVYLATDHEDMKAERKAAHNITFPLLNIMLQKYRMCAIPVDLRSGVTRPQTYGKDCVKIALDEIDRCRPFFLCFLGMRYGFVPFDMYGTLNLPDNSQYDWVKQFPPTLSLLHYEILHAIVNATKPRSDHAAHGHYSAPGMYFHSDPAAKLAPIIRAVYGADYDAEISSRLPEARSLHSSHPVDDARRSRHAFPRTCAPASICFGADVNQFIPSVPSTTLFYMRSPSFLNSANYQEAMNNEEREIDAARKKIEENQLARLESIASAEEVSYKKQKDKEPDDNFWAGDWLEIFIFDAQGLIPKASKKTSSQTQAGKSKREAQLLAAQREVSQNIMSLSRPVTQAGPSKQNAAASAAASAEAGAADALSAPAAPSGLEDDGGGDEDNQEVTSNPVDVSATNGKAPDEAGSSRPKSALRASIKQGEIASSDQQVEFASDDRVFLFEETQDGAVEQRPDTAIHFFGDDHLQTDIERAEELFVNTNAGDGDTLGPSAIASVVSDTEAGSLVETETRNGFQLTLTYGPSVRHSKWIPVTSAAWNELVRIPIREGIRLQGQGKVAIKLIKRINNVDETVGEAKLEVAKLLPFKTDFSVLNISSSAQLSLQAAFIPERVQTAVIRKQKEDLNKKIKETFPLATLKMSHNSNDPRHAFRLAALKTGLVSRANVYENYPCKFLGVDEQGAARFSTMEPLARRVCIDLYSTIAGEGVLEASCIRPRLKLILEAEQQHHFQEASAAQMIGNDEVLARIAAYVKHASVPPVGDFVSAASAIAAANAGEHRWPGNDVIAAEPLLLIGQRGAGMSYILSKLHGKIMANELFASDSQVPLKSSFVTTDSASVAQLHLNDIMTLLLGQIGDVLKGSVVPKPKIGNLSILTIHDPCPLRPLPLGYYKLRNLFLLVLRTMSIRNPATGLCAIVDGIDRIPDCLFDWIPLSLPPHARLIVGAAEDSDAVVRLLARNPPPIVVRVPAVPMVLRKAMISRVLERREESMGMRVRDDIVSMAGAASGGYLQLSMRAMHLIFGINRIAENSTQLPVLVKQFPATLHDLSMVIVERLMQRHDPVLIRRILCLIEISGDGDPGLHPEMVNPTTRPSTAATDVSSVASGLYFLQADSRRSTPAAASSTGEIEHGRPPTSITSGGSVLPLKGLAANAPYSGSTIVGGQCHASGHGLLEKDLRMMLALPEPTWDEHCAFDVDSSEVSDSKLEARSKFNSWSQRILTSRSGLSTANNHKTQLLHDLDHESEVLLAALQQGGDAPTYKFAMNMPPQSWSQELRGLPSALWGSLMQDLSPLLRPCTWQQDLVIQFAVHGLRRFIRERFHLDVLLRDLSVDHSIIFEASKALLDPAGAQRLRSTPSSRPTTSLFVFNADVHRRKNPDAEAPLSLDLKSLPFGTLPLLATSNNMEPRARFFPGHGDNEPSFLPVAAIYHYEIALHMMRLLDPERNRSWLGSAGCIRALMSVPRHLHRAGKWCQLRVLLCSFGYAKLIVNNCCISGAVIQYTEALRCAAAAGAACVPPMSADAWWLGAQQVRDWSSFLSKQARCLSRSPGLLYQLALNEPDYSAVTSSTLHMQVKGWFGGNHLKCVNKMDVFQEAEPIKSIHKAVREFETCSDILNRQALGEAPFVQAHFSLLNNTLLQDAGSAAYLNAADMNGDVEGANIVHVYNASKIMYGHVGWIKATSFTKDDKYLVSGADDKEILVWNCVSGMRIAQMQGHAKSVTCISLSFDTAKLVSGSMDGTAKIWELSSCIEIGTLFVGSVVNSVEFSRDAENVLVASQDAIIRIFHVNTTVELRRMIGHVLSVRCASYGPDGLMVASCSSDLAVILWDLRRPEDDSMVAVLTGHTDDIRQLVWVKQNLQIASCSNDSTIRVWNIDSGSCVRVLTGHKGAVTSLATPGEGLRLVSCGVDGACRIWSTMVSQCLAVFHCSSGPLFSVTVSSDLYTICTTQSDGSIKLWDTRGVITEDPGDGSELVGGKTHSSVSHTRPTTAVSDSAKQWRSRPSSAALHPSAATSAISRHPSAHVLSEASERHSARSSSAASVDNQQSLAATLGRKVIHREAPRTQKGAVCALAFSRTGDVLASASHDGTYALRDANTGMMLCPPRRTNDNGCFALVFSKVEDRIATAGDDDVVRLWDLEYGTAINFFGGNGDYCKSLCFTEDANLLAAGASDSTVRLWDCRAPPPAQRAAMVIQEHSVAVSALGCAPNGYSLLSGDVNGNLRLCDLRKPSIAVQRWLGHTDAVTGISFCPKSVNNVAAVSTSMDGQALLWNRGAVVGSIGRLTPFELQQQLDRTGEHAFPLLGCAVSPSGLHWAISSSDGFARMFKFNPNSVSITSNFPDAEWQCSSAASAIALTDSRGGYDTIGAIAVGDQSGRTYVLHPRLGVCGSYRKI